MNTRNDNPNVMRNHCTPNTEYKIERGKGCYEAYKREPGGNWVQLEYYREDKKIFIPAKFVTMRKANRFIKKLQINMKREEIIERIYNTLIEKGKITSKADALGVDPMEDKVYTKRLSINKNLGEGANTIELVFVSVTSDNDDFAGTTSADMRLNTKNTRDQWCNIFIDEATDEMLELVSIAV